MKLTQSEKELLEEILNRVNLSYHAPGHVGRRMDLKSLKDKVRKEEAEDAKH